jgi:hypothetical protein
MHTRCITQTVADIAGSGNVRLDWRLTDADDQAKGLKRPVRR